MTHVFSEGPFAPDHIHEYKASALPYMKPLVFNSTLQHYSYAKALAFHDLLIAKKILNTEDPWTCYLYASSLKFYEEDHWNNVKNTILVSSLRSKFYPDKEYTELLTSTGYDDIVYDNANKELGGEENLLGKCLMDVRSWINHMNSYVGTMSRMYGNNPEEM